MSSNQTASVSWPMHKGSFRVIPKWIIPDRSDAYRWYRLARQYNRAADSQRCLGSSALRVLEALVYEFQSYSTGRLDPSYERIAEAVGLARSTVAIALRKLATLGLVRWVRRCTGEDTAEGWRLRQQSNAYTLRPPAEWIGYRGGDGRPPAPTRDELGAPATVQTFAERAAAEAATGGISPQAWRDLATATDDPLAKAIASWREAVLGSEIETETSPR